GGVVVQAVHGLGGVGKSTLAAYWARTHLRGHDVAWWITADTPAALEAGLHALAVALEPGLAGQPLETGIAHAVAWLRTHQRWILVLDNVTDPAHVAPLLNRDLPGRVIVTSRLAEGWHRLGARVIRLDVLTEQQATELLAGITGSATGAANVEMADAAALCRELGYLPLAIEQAAGFLHQSRLTPAAYLELLRHNPAVMYDRAVRGSDAERSIARIWRITLDTLTQGTPLAGALLRIMAWWAPEAIPRTLLDPVADPAEVVTALGDLAAYNMITLDTDAITVHRLVQAVARTPDPRAVDEGGDPHRQPGDIDNARQEATTLLHHARPADVGDPAARPAWRALLPHIDALAERTDTTTDTAATSHLLDRAAGFLREQGAIARAIAYYERAHATNQRLYGGDRPNTLTSRNNLASAYQAAGDLGQAIPLLEQTLTGCQQVLGEDHPQTLASRNNLANAYESAGDLRRAISLHEATLADRERVLGRVHSDTLASRNNLASACELAGDLGRAIPLYEATLADRERVLGGDHPDTLASRNNLANAYESAGDLRRAISLHEATLADRERVLGGDHPDALASRNNLAYAYESAGDLGRAIPLYEATLADRERVLGGDHPQTLASRNNLATAYEAAGDLGRAIPLCEATLADRERVLGGDHPDALASRNNLAAAYGSAGDLRRAIPLLEATLADCQRVLGEDHPLTEAVRGNLEAVR
ncbi:tetratricopeptide repeat protein, partial [Actinomadura sp. KC216]|uniref:tetratricopeptide repeat protein n=1 Tax=Actinomadura sp. KC216 TaxID=2530370 RepID=UPI0010516F2B